MTEGFSIEEVVSVVKRIEHPEIAATFHELGMVGDIEKAGEAIVVEIRVPFPNIPIKDYLAGMIQSEVQKIFPGVPVSFNFTVMSDEVRSGFLALARERWKGEI
jgi:metal-sulfur cluster biosynthetic enzyme